MKKGIRTAVYDTALQLEAFRFQGIAQPFPSHFHAYYVIGLIEKGRRSLSCRSTVYSLRPGNIVLFNPGDTHACVQSDEGAMDYRGLNIPRETMLTLAEDVNEHFPLFPRQSLPTRRPLAAYAACTKQSWGKRVRSIGRNCCFC